MDRVELIAKLACKPETATPKPKGLHATAAGLPSVVRKNGLGIPSGREVTGSHNGILVYPLDRRARWELMPDLKEPVRLKPGFRKKAHALTRIAERLKRR